MKKRNLGKNGFAVGEVGLGCWQFGGDFGEMSEQTAFDIMHEAVGQGIDFLDTADVYGGGRSEILIGRFLKTIDQPVRVATKFGRGSGLYPDKYTPRTLRSGIDDSRRRLGVDRIDLLQLHCIPGPILREGAVFDWLREEQANGSIQHFGASVETLEEAHMCLQQDGLLSIQVIFNIFRQKLIDELFPAALEKGVGLIIRLPLASGLLTGKFTADTRFAESDHRNYNRDGQFFNVGETFAGIAFSNGIELVDGLRGILPTGTPMAQSALRWILDHEAVSVVIPGASSVSQVGTNAEVSGMQPLPPGIHNQLKQYYQDRVLRHIRGAY